MCAGQITGGHEKFIDDLPAREDEGLLEQFRPFIFCERMMGIQPVFERALFLLEFKDLLRVDDRRIDLQTVADDTGILKQARTVFFCVRSHLFNLEAMIRLAEVIGFS